MEPETPLQITPEYIKQVVYSVLPEVLAKYQEEREKAFILNPLLERLIRLEEELKALRIEMSLRFEAINERFEAINKRFEAINERFEAINKRFEAQKQESDARFEAINARFEALIKEMNARFEALDKRLSFLQWLMVFGFTFMSLVITLLNFFK